MKSGKFISMVLIGTMFSCANTSGAGTIEDSSSIDSAKITVSDAEIASNTVKEGVKYYDYTLEEALKQARIENKFVFINCCTKTCGPCKKMDKVVLSDNKCGEYINTRFIPIKKDLENTEEGIAIAQKYKVHIFPTYLILNPEGKIHGEIIGCEFNIDNFIGMLNTIMKAEK